jgi:FkbM family methyltransferase
MRGAEAFIAGGLVDDSGIDSFLDKTIGVIHVGANSGQERDQYRRHGLAVVWIEPIEEVFDELVTNIVDYPEQLAFRELITDYDGKAYEFKIANNYGASSSIYEFGEHKDIWPSVQYTGSRTLKSLTLETFFARHNIKPHHYPALVMDVQGAELPVLRGAGNQLLKFRFVKAEAADFESYIGGATLSDLQEHLAKFGFEEISRVEFAKHENGGRYWDVLWERRDSILTEILRL